MFKFFKKTVKFMAPVDGKVIDLTSVPDDTFANKLLGEGIAIEPSNGNFVSPVDGTIETIFKTNHLFGFKMDDGTELIIHVGLDTVKLDGEGFERLVQEGTKVTAGTPILKVDLNFVTEKGYKVVTPLVITTPIKSENLQTYIGKNVVAGKDVVMEYEK